MVQKSTERAVLTVEETRAQLGLSRGLIYAAIRRGEIPSIRVGRRILIPRAALDQLLSWHVNHQEETRPNIER